MRKITYDTPSGTMTAEIGEDKELRFNEDLEAWEIVYEESDASAANDIRTKIIPSHQVYKVDIPYRADSMVH